MKKYIYLSIAILLWSTSSIIVINFKGLFLPFQSASVVTLFSSFFLTLFFYITDKKLLSSILEFSFIKIFKIGLLGLSGVFIYPILYFYGLHSSKPIEANVINYFWPILAVLFGMLFGVEKKSLKKAFAILLGLTGVTVTTLNLHLNNYSASFSFENMNSYLFAFFGAISYGLYSASIKISSFFGSKKNTIDVKLRFLIYLYTSLVLHIIINIILFLFVDKSMFVIDFNFNSFLFLVIYSSLNFSVAYLFWTFSVDELPLFQVSMFAFFIPILSTLFLSYWQQTELTISVIYGLSFIIIGLYIQQDQKSYISPIIGLSLGLIIFGLLLSIIAPSNNTSTTSNYISTLSLLMGIFGILSSFTLSRVIQRYNNENLMMLKIENNLFFLCELALNSGNRKLAFLIDDYMNFIIKKNVNFKNYQFNDLIIIEKENFIHYCKIKEEIKKLNKTDEIEKELNDKIEVIKKDISEWRYLKSRKVSFFEWIILLSLVLVLIIVFIVFRPSIFSYQLISIVFSSSLLLIILAIQDYDLRKPRKKIERVLLTQKISNLLSIDPYIPEELVNPIYFTKDLFPNKENVNIRVKNNGNYIVKNMNIINSYYKTFTIIFLILILLYILYVVFP